MMNHRACGASCKLVKVQCETGRGKKVASEPGAHLLLRMGQPGQDLCGIAISRVLPSSEELWDLNGASL